MHIHTRIYTDIDNFIYTLTLLNTLEKLLHTAIMNAVEQKLRFTVITRVLKKGF